MFDQWVYQDESGEPKRDPFFLASALIISKANRQLLSERTGLFRQKHRFYDEFHFQRVSNTKHRLYMEIMDEILKHVDFTASIIVVRKELLDLSNFFGGQPHLAYNKFCQMLIYHRLKGKRGKVGIFVDDRNRVKRDNFLDYLRSELNVLAWMYGHDFEIRTVEPINSRSDDAAQMNDLFLGAVKQRFDPAPGFRKRDLGAFLENHTMGWKIDVWDWKPKK
jgi:hypothetical protein